MKWGILATGTIAKKFASTMEQMGAEGGSSLLPWGHGIWKAHRRLRSSTASPAAMTPTKPLPRVFCVRKPWYTESDKSKFREVFLCHK